MKVVSYTALHYGADYLGWAIRSVIDHVDEHYVFYTDVGSHGHRTDRPNPDSRDTLKAIAQQAAGDKLRWYEGRWSFEGEQREMIHRYAPDADVILVVDADEVWPAGLARAALNTEIDGRVYPDLCHRYRLPMVHFWRSFRRCILHDPAYPERIIFPKLRNNSVGMLGCYEGDRVLSVAHFGYAQRSEVVEYKQHTHGHKGEWRRDVDWFRDRFMANTQYDCHPVGSEYWNPEYVNPWDYLPDWMKDHPYAKLEVIP